MAKRQTATEKQLATTIANCKKVGRPRDRQMYKVYNWEYDINLGSNRCDWTLVQCSAFLGYVWHCYFGTRSKPPIVEPGYGSSCASAGGYSIVLPRWARNREIILHEVAHSILERSSKGYYALHQESHGPEYLRLFIELHDRFGATTKNALLKSAKKARLKVAHPNAVPRPLARFRTNAKRRRQPASEKRETWLK